MFELLKAMSKALFRVIFNVWFLVALVAGFVSWQLHGVHQQQDELTRIRHRLGQFNDVSDVMWQDYETLRVVLKFNYRHDPQVLGPMFCNTLQDIRMPHTIIMGTILPGQKFRQLAACKCEKEQPPNDE